MIYNDFDTIVNNVVCRVKNAEFFEKNLPGSGLAVSFAPSRAIEPQGRTAQELAECPVVKQALDDLRFPLILKPRVSSAKAHSHDMVIVAERDTLFKVLGLPQFSFLLDDTILVQKYFENHYETLIKLYVIGERFGIARRASFAKKFVDREI